jgi:hypothetical protein
MTVESAATSCWSCSRQTISLPAVAGFSRNKFTRPGRRVCRWTDSPWSGEHAGDSVPRFTIHELRFTQRLRFAHHVQHPSLISIIMELSYEAKRRVAPASCWPRPSDAGTSARSGVSSARVTPTVALRGRVKHSNRRLISLRSTFAKRRAPQKQ